MAEADPKDFQFDLERRLASDDGAAAKAVVLDRLSTLKLEVTRAIRRGVSPDEFKRLEGLSAALQAAESVVAGIKPETGS